MVVPIFCFMGFIGSFFGAFPKNRLAEQPKNAIADNFPRWRFFVANNISLDLWVIVIFVGVIVGFVGISLPCYIILFRKFQHKKARIPKTVPKAGGHYSNALPLKFYRLRFPPVSCSATVFSDFRTRPAWISVFNYISLPHALKSNLYRFNS